MKMGDDKIGSECTFPPKTIFECHPIYEDIIVKFIDEFTKSQPGPTTAPKFLPQKNPGKVRFQGRFGPKIRQKFEKKQGGEYLFFGGKKWPILQVVGGYLISRTKVVFFVPENRLGAQNA